MQRLKEQYRVSDDDAAMVMPPISDIRLNKKGAKLIILLAQDYSAEGAQKQLAQAVQALLAEREKRYGHAMDTQQERLQSRYKQMQQLKKHIVRLPTYIEAVRKQDPAHAAKLAIGEANLLTKMSSLESEYDALQLATSEIQSYPAKLLRDPTLPVRQVKPKSKLIVAFAVARISCQGAVALTKACCSMSLLDRRNVIQSKISTRDGSANRSSFYLDLEIRK